MTSRITAITILVLFIALSLGTKISSTNCHLLFFNFQTEFISSTCTPQSQLNKTPTPTTSPATTPVPTVAPQTSAPTLTPLALPTPQLPSIFNRSNEDD